MTADLPAIDGVDTVRGLASVGSNAGVYRRLLALFCEHHADEATIVAGLIAADRSAEAARRLHRLRGSALVLGIVGVADLAADLEGELRQSAGPRDGRRFDALAAVIPQVVEAIHGALTDR